MRLSIVIPVYNEAAVLPLLGARLVPVIRKITEDYQVIFVDDGSTDASAGVLSAMSRSDARLTTLHFSRNFGHQAAVTAGLDYANGDAVAVMDADLQDPPELLESMVELYKQGYDVVSAQRICREVDTPFKRVSARSFYWLMQKMVDQRLKRDVGDYRLLSKRAVEAVREFREQHRFMRGLIAWLGLREAIVPFQREHRAAGCTKYSLLKMLRFSWTAITSFSALPLRLALGLGTVMACLGFLIFVWACYSALVLHATVPGWTSLVAVQSVFSGITLFCVGLMGDFVGRIYEETKGRPLYVVTEVDNGSARPAWRERTVVIAAEMNSKKCDKDLEFGRKPLHGIPSLEAQPDPEREVCNGIRV